MAKAAEETLVRSLAREVSGSGVTANLVLIRKLDAGHERETAPTATNASWASPEEVAETIAFLASPSAAAVNGARIPLYGRS
jgi:NAD(P)-dependent dehydrogenase (short-subunit alcohol dehydrogenase family)